MGTKRKRIEDELSRFEAEISKPAVQTTMFVPSQLRPVIGANTFQQVQLKLHNQQHQQHHSNHNNHNNNNNNNNNNSGNNNNNNHYNHHHSSGSQSNSMIPNNSSSTTVPPPQFLPTFVPSNAAANAIENANASQKSYNTSSIEPTPIVLASAPKLYNKNVNVPKHPPAALPVSSSHIDISSIQFDVTQKLRKLKAEKSGPNPIAEEAIKAAKASSALQSFQLTERRKKDRKTVRIAGGQVWEDHSLADWPDDDFRIFCGDLGNDVNDEVLTRTFNKYPSFQRAKVIRDKRTGKSKGFGFVSFREPQDFIKAMKEIDGRYVGSRPIKLRKSSWKQRSLDFVKKKDKEKQTLMQLFQK